MPISRSNMRSPPDINECEREGMGCGDPLENCVNSAGSYECVCKTGYKRVDGKCQLEGIASLLPFDRDNFMIVAGLHVFMLFWGVCSVGLRGTGALVVIYILGFSTFTAVRLYKEGAF